MSEEDKVYDKIKKSFSSQEQWRIDRSIQTLIVLYAVQVPVFKPKQYPDDPSTVPSSEGFGDTICRDNIVRASKALDPLTPGSRTKIIRSLASWYEVGIAIPAWSTDGEIPIERIESAATTVTTVSHEPIQDDDPEPEVDLTESSDESGHDGFAGVDSGGADEDDPFNV